MDIQNIPFTFINPPKASTTGTGTGTAAGQSDFQSRLLAADTSAQPSRAAGAEAEPLPSLPPLDRISVGSRAKPAPAPEAEPAPSPAGTGRAAAGAYEKQTPKVVESTFASGYAAYKDDQLLSNPGGDHYDLENGRYVADPSEQKSFWGRVGKDIKDAFANVKNFVGDLMFGSTMHYRDENGQIQEARKSGLVGSVVDFFKDLGSALSFGSWRPDGEEAPKTFGERVGFFFSKLKEAVFGDLFQGVAGSVVNMGEDLLLAGWNLAETVPDATIGNTEAGQKITTAVFDNGQVALDYLTDILPGGEASVRVHSPDPENRSMPILNNIAMPERNSADVRWKYVRNTPFRKTIETVGSLLFDIVSLKFLGDIHFIGGERHNPEP